MCGSEAGCRPSASDPKLQREEEIGVVADMMSVAVLAWPAVWLAGGFVYYGIRCVCMAMWPSGRNVVAPDDRVPPKPADDHATSLSQLQEVLDRLREQLPLLTAVAEVLRFDPGPCVSVVGVVRLLRPCEKGGMIGYLADTTGQIPVWLPDADGVTGPKEGAVVIVEGQVCCSSNHRRWLKAVSWGNAE